MENNQKNLKDNKDRFDYFISTVLQNEEVWLLKAQEGMYAMFEDNNGNPYLPVWPEKHFSNEFIKDEWENYISEKMELKEFKTWLYELKEDKIIIAVFPEIGMKTTPVKPEELIELLRK